MKMELKSYNRRSITACIVLFCAIVLNAQNTIYYNVFKTWTPELEDIASRGENIKALVCLGSCYDRGAGVAQDRKKAFSLFVQAAEKLDPLGLYNLGLYYSEGYCCESNNVKAIALMENATTILPSFSPAYLKMAQIYEYGGAGIKQNQNKAFENWIKLADCNDRIGQYQAGRCYHYGVGVEKDSEKAKAYYLKGSNSGDANSMEGMGLIFLESKEFESAFRWLKMAYEKGNLYVCHNLGDLYYYGNGTEQSYQKAFEIFQKGASLNPRCKYRMGVMLRNGFGVSKNQKLANELLLEAAEKGINKAQYLIGLDFYNGEFRKKDYSSAIKYLSMAMNDKFLIKEIKADIYQKLSICYRFGRGIQKNEHEADVLSNMAAELGEPNALKIKEWLQLN